MTGLVLRRVRSGKMAKLKGIPVVPGPISEGVVKLERVQVICPACGQQVEAIATDGRVKGYCAVARQSVDFLVETQHVLQVNKHFTAEARDKISASAKKHWQDPEFRAEQIAAQKKRWQDPEYRAERIAAAKKHWQDPEYRAKQSAARIRQHNKRG